MKTAPMKRCGIRKGKGRRRIHQEIQEQREIHENIQEILDDIHEANEENVRDDLVEIRKELKDQLQKIPKILNSNMDIQEQLRHIRKNVRNHLNYIQQINDEILEGETQKQLQDIRKIIRKILRTISTAINPRIIIGEELNPSHLAYKTWLSNHQQQIQSSNGRWNMIQKQVSKVINIEKWMILNFSTSRSCSEKALTKFANRLCQQGKTLGMKLAHPLFIKNFNERSGSVEDFVKEAKEIEPNIQLAVVVLPTNRPQETFARVKAVAETEVGLMTQCVNDWHVTKKKLKLEEIFKVSQKINAKMGRAIICLLSEEIPSAFRNRTLIIGGAICKSTRNLTNSSIAALVGSFDSSFSKYKSCVRLQQNKTSLKSKIQIHEIADLKEMVKELLSEFCENCEGKLPEKIIFYRFKVNEEEYGNIFNNELKQIEEACKETNVDKNDQPLVSYIIVEKLPQKHFTNSFICIHPNKRKRQPTRYTLISASKIIQNNLSIEDLQILSHYLCHVSLHFFLFSVPCPINYTLQAIDRVNQYLIAKIPTYEMETNKEREDFELEMFQQISRSINVAQELKTTIDFT